MEDGDILEPVQVWDNSHLLQSLYLPAGCVCVQAELFVV